MADALAELVAGHDGLEASLDDARARYGEASAAYQALVDAIAAYEARITELASRVSIVTADAAGLPGSVTVAAPKPVAAAGAPAPVTVRPVTTVAKPAATPKPVATAITESVGQVSVATHGVGRPHATAGGRAGAEWTDAAAARSMAGAGSRSALGRAVRRVLVGLLVTASLAGGRPGDPHLGGLGSRRCHLPEARGEHRPADGPAGRRGGAAPVAPGAA